MEIAWQIVDAVLATFATQTGWRQLDRFVHPEQVGELQDERADLAPPQLFDDCFHICARQASTGVCWA